MYQDYLTGHFHKPRIHGFPYVIGSIFKIGSRIVFHYFSGGHVTPRKLHDNEKSGDASSYGCVAILMLVFCRGRMRKVSRGSTAEHPSRVLEVRALPQRPLVTGQWDHCDTAKRGRSKNLHSLNKKRGGTEVSIFDWRYFFLEPQTTIYRWMEMVKQPLSNIKIWNHPIDSPTIYKWMALGFHLGIGAFSRKSPGTQWCTSNTSMIVFCIFSGNGWLLAHRGSWVFKALFPKWYADIPI